MVLELCSEVAEFPRRPLFLLAVWWKWNENGNEIKQLPVQVLMCSMESYSVTQRGPACVLHRPFSWPKPEMDGEMDG